MRAPAPAVDAGFRLLNVVHRGLLRLSGGRLDGTPFGMPVVELHSVGRRSGKARTTVLAAPVAERERVVLVASKGGDDRDPDWYRNLVAQPDVELTLGGTRRAMRARTATDEERRALWPQVVAAYRGYEAYQRRTSRRIPLVICEPR